MPKSALTLPAMEIEKDSADQANSVGISRYAAFLRLSVAPMMERAESRLFSVS